MSPEDKPAAEGGRQFNSGRPKEPPRPEAETYSINTAAELSLYLIMCLPEESDRLQRVRDFVRLYHIEEKRPVDPRTGHRTEAPTWSDEQLRAIEEQQRTMRGLGRIAQPEPKR
jgi:hypothetical protein